ncbi:hypothetical protein M8J76_016927 [Diaphorina citri]|nr:hypothetical protein M8J75_012716 [Diaphorina citri]KAI5714427.1 hypothetical protein M8J76_016927 [Diaphorina citri]
MIPKILLLDEASLGQNQSWNHTLFRGVRGSSLPACPLLARAHTAAPARQTARLAARWLSRARRAAPDR